MGKGGDTTQVQQTNTRVTTSSEFNPTLIVGSTTPVITDQKLGREGLTNLLELSKTPSGPNTFDATDIPAPTLTKTTVFLIVAAGLTFYFKR